MQSMRIVPAFDELKHSQAGFRLCSEGFPVEQFTFQRGKETFAQGIIVFFKLQLVEFFEGVRSNGWILGTVKVNMADR
jgi:hypothetical protein